MKTAKAKGLQALVTQARALSADMRAITEAPRPTSVSNVSAVMYDLDQLANAVFHADRIDQSLSKAQIMDVLQTAFTTKVGMFALGGTTVHIDLGNGRVLSCLMRPKGH